MALPIILFVLAFLAFIVMGLIIAKHWQEIRLLDPDTIKEEQQRKQRNELLVRRFERVSSEKVMPLKRIGRAVGKGIKSAYESGQKKMQQLEDVYRKTTKPLLAMASPSTRERLKVLMNEARSLARDSKWAEAERRLLDSLQIDAKNADAYKLLGQIYLKQKLFPQAKETFEFLLKLKKANDAVYAGLAEISAAEGNMRQAEQFLQKALEASPKQAHRHAELARFYLDRTSIPEKSWGYAKQAQELEPGSVKYLELSLEAAVARQDIKEAQKRLEKLRLATDDQAKWHSWREKVESIAKRSVE
jgi:tetratricopeptide (TPR) repeat protein